MESRPSNMGEVIFAGARQRTHGCSPRGLGGAFVLVQGLQTLSHWVALLGWPSSVFFSRHRHFFQPASALFQPASALSVLVQRPGVQLSR